MIRTVTPDAVTRTGANRSQVRRVLRAIMPGDAITFLIGQTLTDPASTYDMPTADGTRVELSGMDGDMTLIIRAPQDNPQDRAESSQDMPGGITPGNHAESAVANSQDTPGELSEVFGDFESCPGCRNPMGGIIYGPVIDMPGHGQMCPSCARANGWESEYERSRRIIGRGIRASYSSAVRLIAGLDYTPGEARELMRECRTEGWVNSFQDATHKEWLIRYARNGRRAGWEISPLRPVTIEVRTIKRGPDEHTPDCDSAACYCDGVNPGKVISDDTETYTVDGMDVAFYGSAVNWATHITDRMGVSEASVYPLPRELSADDWMSGTYSDPYGRYEESVTVRATDGWDPQDRADFFRASLRMIPGYSADNARKAA